MRTFVGYGYNERDKWVEEMVFPIIQAFGDEVIHGRLMPGEVLAEGVRERIRRADIVIGFATRRLDPLTNSLGQATHKWVVQELGIALGLPNSPGILEVREAGGDFQEGVTAGV